MPKEDVKNSRLRKKYNLVKRYLLPDDADDADYRGIKKAKKLGDKELEKYLRNQKKGS